MLAFSSCLLAVASAQLASGSLFPTFPTASDVCAVSQNCQLKWIDSKDPPSTSTLGQTAIDLVTGDASNLQLIQRLGGVDDPSKATAYTFVPQANLSSTAKYAVRFLPAKGGDPIFSTYFKITGGSGTATPISSIASTAGISPKTAAVNTTSANATTAKTVSSANNNLNSVNSTTAANDASKSGSISSNLASLYPSLITSAASLILMLAAC